MNDVEFVAAGLRLGALQPEVTLESEGLLAREEELQGTREGEGECVCVCVCVRVCACVCK